MPLVDSASSALNAAIDSGVMRRLRAAGDDRVDQSPDSISRLGGADRVRAAPSRRRRCRTSCRAGRSAATARRRRRCSSSAAPRAAGPSSAPYSISSSLPRSSVPMPPMPVPMTEPMRSASYGFARRLPAGLGQRLVARDDRELREAVGAARLLDREVLGRLELASPRPCRPRCRSARAPALIEGAGADAERRDGAHPR